MCLELIWNDSILKIFYTLLGMIVYSQRYPCLQPFRLALFFLVLLTSQLSYTQDQYGENVVLVPGTGSELFNLGRSDIYSFKDVKEREISLNSFHITKHEITNEEFKKFLTEANIDRKGKLKGSLLINLTLSRNLVWSMNKFIVKEGKESLPVSYVTWYGANEYCKWRGGRLPTEAEWEYAARGGMNSHESYSGSDFPDEVGWYNENSNGELQPVGQKKPNKLGVYDMSGNVMEWVNDWYPTELTLILKKNDPELNHNPQGPKRGKSKIARGGGWNRQVENMSIIKRYPLSPAYSNSNLGFRCVFDLIN